VCVCVCVLFTRTRVWCVAEGAHVFVTYVASASTDKYERLRAGVRAWQGHLGRCSAARARSQALFGRSSSSIRCCSSSACSERHDSAAGASYRRDCSARAFAGGHVVCIHSTYLRACTVSRILPPHCPPAQQKGDLARRCERFTFATPSHILLRLRARSGARR